MLNTVFFLFSIVRVAQEWFQEWIHNWAIKKIFLFLIFVKWLNTVRVFFLPKMFLNIGSRELSERIRSLTKTLTFTRTQEQIQEIPPPEWLGGDSPQNPISTPAYSWRRHFRYWPTIEDDILDTDLQLKTTICSMLAGSRESRLPVQTGHVAAVSTFTPLLVDFTLKTKLL